MQRSALLTLGFRDLPDEATLRARYHELLFAHHPDLRGQRSTERTSEIIKAYRALRKETPQPRGPAADTRSGARQARSATAVTTGRASSPAFQLLRGPFGNIALPIGLVDGFVRARDASIIDDRFRAVASHRGRSYVLFSPGGKHVSAKAPVHWLLLLRTHEGSALAFRDRPEADFIVPERETLLLRSPAGTGTIVVGGMAFQIPPIPGIEL